MKLNQPTTPAEYWKLIELGYSRNLVPHTYATEAAFKQLKPIMHGNSTQPDIEALIVQICDLPFPKDLGMVDSREYDTLLASVIGGLQNVVKTNGGVPNPLPTNAPKAARTVRQGMMSWQEGGTARAHDQWQKDCVKETADAQAKIDALDSTETCKKALAEAYKGDPVKGIAKNWKRIKKENKGDRVFRTFEAAGEQAQVVFDPSEEKPEKALAVFKEAPVVTAPNQFPKIIGPELSGKVLFGLNTIEDDEVTFHCGPQTDDDHLSDQYSCSEEIRPVIEHILGSRECDLYCAENFHTVKPAKGETPKELAAYLDKAMKAAGALVENENDIDL